MSVYDAGIRKPCNAMILNLKRTEGIDAVATNVVTKTMLVDLDLGDYVCYITLNSIHL